MKQALYSSPVSRTFLGLSPFITASSIAAFLVAAPLGLPGAAQNLDLGLTSFSNSLQLQTNKVNSLKNLKYNIAVPLNISDLTPAKLGDGSFQIADLDFTQSVATIPGTNKRIGFAGATTVDANGKPTSARLYSVVAGKQVPKICPIQIAQTKIAFFDTIDAANKQASIWSKDYLVYVTANKEVQKDAAAKIKQLNCKPDSSGVIVDGRTKNVSVDFTKVWPLLPRELQQPAKNGPFTYGPQVGTDIFVVNARKIYK
jgi:hypothetical protein